MSAPRAHEARRRRENAAEGELSLEAAAGSTPSAHASTTPSADASSTEPSPKHEPKHEHGPIVRPYGDTTGDGMVQMSFTLPLPHDKRAEGAAVRLAQSMGMEPALLVHAKAMGPTFTFFVLYGPVKHLVDIRDIEIVEREYELLNSTEVNQAIKNHLRRKLVVVGACIGTDAHTVGIDAILNIKGFAGEKGLEYYREMTVHNLGAQVLIPDLVAAAKDLKADAVLVSQVVTQRDAHIHNTTAMSAAFREAFPTGQVPHLIIGGPRFEEGAAASLGVNRIFGRGTTPGEVASYLVHALVDPTTKTTNTSKGQQK